MAPLRQPDKYHAQEEALLFNSLCLLDAPNAEGGKLLEFSKTMFRKPNAKALEFLLHFVYSLTNGKAAAKKYFKGLWPLLDKDRKQAKEFYQRAQDWLKETGQLDAHGHSLSPFQRNPSGPKLVSFLVDLTDWVLRIHHQRLFPQDTVAHSDLQDPQLLLALSEPLLTAARAQNQLQAERLLRVCQQGAQVQQQAEQVAASLRDDYYTLTAQLAEQCKAASSLPQAADCLHQDCSSTSSSTALPPDLQAQQQELQQLWAQLDQHLDACAALSGLVSSLAGSDVHPYAIDGLQLRLAAPPLKQPCDRSSSATDTNDLANTSMDVAAIMEAWLADLSTVCSYMRQLAGTDKPEQQQSSWGLLMGSSSASGSGVTPLVASSDAASHAPHLYAQLNLHRSCLEQMKGMKASLATNTAAAVERVQQLDAQLSCLMDAEEQRCMLLAAAEDDQELNSDAGDVYQLGGAPGGPYQHRHDAGGNLFAGGFQLVPPTPMLQQLVQQQQAGPGGPAPGVSHKLQQLLRDSSTTPPEAAAVTPHRPSSSGSQPAPSAAAGAGRAVSPTLLGLCSPCASDAAAPAAAAEVAADDSPLASPGGSSVSSAALPAAELLMTQDIMDVDLIMSDDYDHDGLPSTTRHALVTADGYSADANKVELAGMPAPLTGRLKDFSHMRISLELMHGQAVGEQLLAAEESLGDVTGLALTGTSRSSTSGGISFRLQASSRRPGLEVEHNRGSNTPRWPGQACEAVAEAGAGTMPGATVAASAVTAGESPNVFGEQPLGPLSQPGSDRLSSARPRRLTFAAAGSAEDRGALVGSPANSSSDGGEEEEQVGAAAHAATAAAEANLESLRQRFANLHKR